MARRGDGYALAVAPEAVDATLAAVEAAAGRAALAGGDVSRARDHFEAGLGWWRGEPFVDWRDAVWAEAERRRLKDVRAGLLEARIDADLAQGRHREVVAELEALVGADPLHEGWWTRLMLALYRSDRQADALAAGRRARSRLVEELGVDPGPGLRRMEQAILDQADGLDSGGAPPQLAVQPAVDAASQNCPYRGLAAYQPVDADLFHGRGAAVRALVADGADHPGGGVGSIGGGQVSLVRAGLLPALGTMRCPGVTAGPVVSRPGGAGRPAGAAALDARPPRRGPGRCGPSSPVVLVVDQFQEL